MVTVCLIEDIAVRITRRDFLKILVAAPVVGINVSHASNKGRLGISTLNIYVPAWLFDEKNNKKARVQALSIEENKEAKAIVVLFDRNRQFTIKRDTSVQWLMQRNGNRPSRKSMLLKRLISYSLDAIYSSIADKRNPEKGTSLRKRFDALQAKEVIEMITIGAMYDLLSKLGNLPMISYVSWDGVKRRFIVH